MEVAKSSLLSMLKQLKEDDWLSIVTFNTEANVAYPLTQWKQANAEDVKKKIGELKAGGGTDLGIAFLAAQHVFESQEVLRSNNVNDDKDKPVKASSHIENRIMFFTDMQPTSGETQKGGLFALADECGAKGVYTTFVGIGQDFGAELTQHITTNLRGGQYMTIRNAREFEDLMTENFDYSVFPVAFDFQLQLTDPVDAQKNAAADSHVNSFAIDHVYGTRLLSLTNFENALTGQTEVHTCNALLDLSQSDEELIQTTGVRKVVLLTHFTNLCRAILCRVPITNATGIPADPKLTDNPSVNSNADVNASSSNGESLLSIKDVIESFKHYYSTTSKALQDSSLDEQLLLLDSIAERFQ
ncbi:von Willebrand factor type A domain-containing protein [Reticulomyxa filosa]|uniref:von Willebrand factor type A domain-containing protein n=1 Tax=Reticulomyxa filosa TaxID=46433 RepID=X6MLY4_RETFI|nr:von Willebrand factor type A domain-containing protein [Reticulomyxa filosa]|eukprot:ETO14854.1 von Willebrand factor type A domain-containing protein [Reticulomyxa filosa]